ncbi:hypothetical protein JSE7799_03865 [Jannaschia seosinensis]|uniref:Uncharacterized protein n=1 Tax=Jannaschia seosinensis TaxID=313367 RepID=A0A0M7BH72_9RHOB|nr:hypothetical protein [Jannaschia seosinensis]CUH41122.1 hypothetical protein JSE7799_03865 [Jannaschia seosinensis]
MEDEQIKETVLVALHATPDGYRTLVRDIAAAHPDMAARALEAALLAAARDMDGEIQRDGGPTNEARTARRLALLLSMDIDRLERDGEVSMADLMAYWTKRDDFFLRL